jgi:hypothetical protein
MHQQGGMHNESMMRPGSPNASNMSMMGGRSKARSPEVRFRILSIMEMIEC